MEEKRIAAVDKTVQSKDYLKVSMAAVDMSPTYPGHARKVKT